MWSDCFQTPTPAQSDSELGVGGLHLFAVGPAQHLGQPLGIGEPLVAKVIAPTLARLCCEHSALQWIVDADGNEEPNSEPLSIDQLYQGVKGLHNLLPLTLAGRNTANLTDTYYEIMQELSLFALFCIVQKLIHYTHFTVCKH